MKLTNNQQIAIERYNSGEKPSYSTGICGSITAGYGNLDEYGYWEFDLIICSSGTVHGAIPLVSKLPDELRVALQDYTTKVAVAAQLEVSGNNNDITAYSHLRELATNRLVGILLTKFAKETK